MTDKDKREDLFLPPVPDDVYDSRFPGGIPIPLTPEEEELQRLKLARRLGNMWSHEDD